MTNAELNTRAAEIMGWVPYQAWFLDPNPETPMEQRVLILQTDWNPCENIAQAFDVVRKIREGRFTQRVRFEDALRDEMRLPSSGAWIAWPYAVMFMEPINLVRACVAAAEKKNA